MLKDIHCFDVNYRAHMSFDPFEDDIKFKVLHRRAKVKTTNYDHGVLDYD